MKKKCIVTLTEAERQMLQAMLSRGKAAARKLAHARILLKADVSGGKPAWSDEAIAEGLVVGRATVERVQTRFVGEGRETGLGASQALDGIIDESWTVTPRSAMAWPICS